VRNRDRRPWLRRAADTADIGVAYDGSKESKAALAIARQLATQTRASVRALQVVSPPTYVFTGLVPTEMAESMEAVLENVKTKMEELPGVEGEAVYGLPGQGLGGFSNQVDL